MRRDKVLRFATIISSKISARIVLMEKSMRGNTFFVFFRDANCHSFTQERDPGSACFLGSWSKFRHFA